MIAVGDNNFFGFLDAPLRQRRIYPKDKPLGWGASLKSKS